MTEKRTSGDTLVSGETRGAWAGSQAVCSAQASCHWLARMSLGVRGSQDSGGPLSVPTPPALMVRVVQAKWESDGCAQGRLPLPLCPGQDAAAGLMRQSKLWVWVTSSHSEASPIHHLLGSSPQAHLMRPWSRAGRLASLTGRNENREKGKILTHDVAAHARISGLHGADGPSHLASGPATAVTRWIPRGPHGS